MSDKKSLTPPQLPIVVTIDQLTGEIDQILLLADRNLPKFIVASVIANRFKVKPVWVFLVAPPSGGKTVMIDALNGLDFIHPVDTLTSNTFASGMKSQGSETSLLLRIQNGILSIKDFTTILGMNEKSRDEIMGQLRAIYDGTFVKQTGAGKEIKWKGRLGFIAGVTPVIYEQIEKFTQMGERFILYDIKQPGRREVPKRMFQNEYAGGMEAKELHMKECFTAYVESLLDLLDTTDMTQFKLEETLQDELIEVADLASKARTGLTKNWKNAEQIEWIPDAELPTRLASQLNSLGLGLKFINFHDQTKIDPRGIAPSNAPLKEEDKEILFKIALDSIPRKRWIVLKKLAEYKHGGTTAGIAMSLHYHTNVMKETLFELNALEFCTRQRDGGTDLWQISDEWLDIVLKFGGIDQKNDTLRAKDSQEDYSEVNAENASDFDAVWGGDEDF